MIARYIEFQSSEGYCLSLLYVPLSGQSSNVDKFPIPLPFPISKKHDEKKEEQESILHRWHVCVHPNIIQYLDKQDPFLFSRRCSMQDNIIHRGILSTCQWYLGTSDFQRIIFNETQKDRMLNTAARYGHQHIIQWLRTMNSQPVAWTYSTMYYAVIYCHWNLVKWMRIQGCPWGLVHCSNIVSKTDDFQFLQWCLDGPDPCPLDDETIPTITRMGKLQMLQWLVIEKHCQVSSHACKLASWYGHLSILKWLQQHGRLSTEDICNNAVISKS
jgi:hypothetical protein